MKETFSLFLSTLALGISALTAWLTLLRKGKLRMTNPTPLTLQYENNIAKISFSTMFYSSAFRGQVVESMYVVLRQKHQTCTFNRWVYKNNSTACAGGLYVRPEGIAQVHQFYSSSRFVFQPGDLVIEIYAILANMRRKEFIKTIILEIPQEKRAACYDDSESIDFEWEPDRNRYSLKE